MEAEPAYLPAQVVKAISLLALQDEPNPASRLLLLLSMCGVCHQWRQLCKEVAAETTVSFDGMETAPPAPGGMMARFRKTAADKKTGVFEAAAKLLTGERGARKQHFTMRSDGMCMWPGYHQSRILLVALKPCAQGCKGSFGNSSAFLWHCSV